MAKIKLGNRPKNFKRIVKFQMLEGGEGAIECVYKYRTRKEFGEFIDGIMEAANKGAFEAGGTSVGLHIKLPKETKHNDFQTINLPFQHFVSRKATFFMHSLAYVVLPGGFGTLDELFEAVTLMQTGKIPPGPVILVGTEFWAGLMNWVRSQLEQTSLINPLDRHTLIIEDEPQRVVQHLVDFYKDHPGITARQPNAPV